MKTAEELRKRINVLMTGLNGHAKGNALPRRYDLTDYTESMHENFEQIDAHIDTVNPKEALARLAMSLDNADIKFKQSGIALSLDPDEQWRLHDMTTALFKRHDKSKFNAIRFSHYQVLCNVMPVLSKVCLDYPENIHMLELYKLSHEDPEFFKSVRGYAEKPYMSAAGNHIIQIGDNANSEDLTPLMMAENQNGRNYFWTPTYDGSRTKIQEQQRKMIQKCAEMYGNGKTLADFKESNRIVTRFMDTATTLFAQKKEMQSNDFVQQVLEKIQPKGA